MPPGKPGLHHPQIRNPWFESFGAGFAVLPCPAILNAVSFVLNSLAAKLTLNRSKQSKQRTPSPLPPLSVQEFSIQVAP
jgi:hypothetical protein